MGLFLPKDASRLALKAARQAQDERRGIIKALSHGQVSRRDLIKMGLFTGAGMLAGIRGLHPLERNLLASTPGGPGIPTGLLPSPMFGVSPFSTSMPRFDVLPRKPIDCSQPLGSPMMPLDCVPTRVANTTDRYNIDPALVNGQTGLTGPAEGRPGGDMWAHQMWDRFAPQVAVEVTQRGNIGPNTSYNPQVSQSQLSLMGIQPGGSIPLQFHPGLPVQDENSVWTFNGTIPPKLMLGRYGEAILFRHHNGLPADVQLNNGFGRHTISTHEHNGHHGAENDGFTGAFFFPGQYYDYHYPILLAGFTSYNTGATDRFASSPTDAGGLMNVAGDWHETMSTHWFHDHMFSFTSQNVYKGNAGMFNLYSGLDRGAEDINDGVNLRLPSGQAKQTGKSWGNLDYDVNLMLADKAFDSNGQLAMDILQFDGFIGDVMTVNLTYRPFMNVERRKYRFRILNASVSRFFKVALSNASGTGQYMYQIANDGNLLPRAVKLTTLDEQGIAERYDVVVDFSKFQSGTRLYFVNCCEHQDGKLPAKDLSVAEAFSGASPDPCVGKFLEFRVGGLPTYADKSFVPGFTETYPPSTVAPAPMSGTPAAQGFLIPNPDLSGIPVANVRTFEFNRGANQTSINQDTSFTGPWGISTNGMGTLAADFGRVSAVPKPGTREIWHLNNGGGGWDHPIHIHFEEGQILDRDGLASNVPLWERGRKDVYRLRAAGTVTLTMQFRDFAGTYMEHCHNTVHEDNAMLVRWDINGDLQPLQTPIPTPQGVNFIDPDDVLPGA
jgi:FtsP/CotA-like multicopper oxidase with cupredoxin domain